MPSRYGRLMALVQHPAGNDRLDTSPHRRALLFRVARLGLLALFLPSFSLPYGVRSWIPPFLPFLLALALEVQFFVGGYRRSRRGGAAPLRDRGPQGRGGA